MRKLTSISFVGAGALAGGVARRLREAGYRVDEIVVRNRRESLAKARRLATDIGANAVAFECATFASDVVWFAVSDDAIGHCAKTAAELGTWKSRIALHSSGALTSDELEPLRKRGASCASLHPMMTFVKNAAPKLDGVSFAVEGDRQAVAVAKRIATDLRGNVFNVKKQAKPLYHAFGAFLSPLLVAELTAAEEVARAAGIPRNAVAGAMAPIIMRTLENYFAEGGANAFSGPLVRGDAETIRRHIAVLGSSPVAEVYRTLAKYAVGKLPVKNRRELEKLLRKRTQ